MKRPIRRRSGFFMIVGWRVISTRERASQICAECPNCRLPDARLIGRHRRAWFTIFLVPILPLDKPERTERISQCLECKQMFHMPIEQLARRAGAIHSNSLADTFAVYNDLRDHPADGQILLKLLKMYEALGEQGEAESASRHFPEAMEAEPACAEVLNRMRRNPK